MTCWWPVAGRRPWRRRLAAGLFGVTAIVALWAVPGRARGEDGAIALSTAAFLDTLGVNLHIGSGPYNDVASLDTKLRYLGIRNVRQSSPIDAAGLATMQALGKLGAKFDLIVNGGGPVNLDGAMRTIHDMAPYLNAVEGVNEAVIYPITYKGQKGVDAAVALQKDLYKAVRASPALAKAAVYIFTLGGVDPGAFPSIGDLSQHTDFANVHSYPPHGIRPIFVLHAAIDGGRTSAPAKPVVVTETGYYTLPNHAGWGGVPERVQASYLLSLLLDQAAARTARTYLYDMIDNGPDLQQKNREDRFGLFRYDGTPKPSAVAVHNMTRLLADEGAGFQPRFFPFTAVGVPFNHTGNVLALEKSDGSRILAVWNEQQLWDPDTRTEMPLRHFPTRITFPTRHATIRLHDPLLGPEAVETFHDVAELTIDLTDHPLFLVVSPDRPGGALPVKGR